MPQAFLIYTDPVAATSDIRFEAIADGAAGNVIAVQVVLDVGMTQGDPPTVTDDGNTVKIVSPIEGVNIGATLFNVVDAVNATSLLVTAEVIGDPAKNIYSLGYTWGLSGGADEVEGAAAVEFGIEAAATGNLLARSGGAATLGMEAEAAGVVVFGSSLSVEMGIDVAANGMLLATSGANARFGMTAGCRGGLLASSGGAVRFGITAKASSRVFRPSTTICDVVADIFLQWGIEKPCAAPDFTKESAINCLNEGMQTVWNEARDRHYWTRQTLSVSYTGGASEIVLSDAVQSVIGPVRYGGRNLIPMTSPGERHAFYDNYGEVPSFPVGYHADSRAQTAADPARVALMLLPPPMETTTVTVDVVMEPPRYTVLDLATCPLVPLPHRYIESLLLPVTRYLASKSHLFVNEAGREDIRRGYVMASALLERANPATPPERKEDA
jgi:hypothetical protein